MSNIYCLILFKYLTRLKHHD